MSFVNSANESAAKVLLTSEKDVFGGHLTLPNHEIVDSGAFYEVPFFCISPKNLLGNFFDSLNDKFSRARYEYRLERLVGPPHKV